MVLGLAKVLVTHNSEEVILSRLHQLGIYQYDPEELVLVLDKDEPQEKPTAIKQTRDQSPSEFLVKHLFNAIRVACIQTCHFSSKPTTSRDHLLILRKMTSKLLIMVAGILSSGKPFLLII